MKTRDLIKRLHEVDSSGELEVCVSNADIHFIEKLPGYYDGASQILKKDSNGNVIGASYNRSKDKIQIHTLPIIDLIFHYDNIEIDYSALSEQSAINIKQVHDDHLKFKEKVDQEIELELFTEWVKSKINEDLLADVRDFSYEILEHFKYLNISYKDEIIIPDESNYEDARKNQWDIRFKVFFEDGFLSISKNEEQLL